VAVRLFLRLVSTFDRSFARVLSFAPVLSLGHTTGTEAYTVAETAFDSPFHIYTGTSVILIRQLDAKRLVTPHIHLRAYVCNGC